MERERERFERMMKMLGTKQKTVKEQQEVKFFVSDQLTTKYTTDQQNKTLRKSTLFRQYFFFFLSCFSLLHNELTNKR